MKRFFTNLLGTSSKATKTASRATHNAFQPSFDELETRDCMSTTAVLNSLGVLNIIGDAKVQKVAVSMNETKSLVDVAIGKKHKMFKTDLVKEINIDLKGGNDFLKVDATSPLWSGKKMAINQTSGNDTADLLFGADANATLDNAFAVRVVGGSGVTTPNVVGDTIMGIKGGSATDGAGTQHDLFCRGLGDEANMYENLAEHYQAIGDAAGEAWARDMMQDTIDFMMDNGCWVIYMGRLNNPLDTQLELTTADGGSKTLYIEGRYSGYGSGDAEYCAWLGRMLDYYMSAAEEAIIDGRDADASYWLNEAAQIREVGRNSGCYFTGIVSQTISVDTQLELTQAGEADPTVAGALVYSESTQESR